MYNLSLQNSVLSSFNLTHLTLNRETDTLSADYFKVIIFWKKTLHEK